MVQRIHIFVELTLPIEKFNIMNEGLKRTAQILRYTARITLLLFGTLIFLFALASGSEEYGGGIMGLIKNSPNTIPWVVLLGLVFISFKWELIGGILITILGLFAMGFFVIFTPNFFLFTLFVALIPIVFGSFLIISWYLSGRAKDKESL